MRVYVVALLAVAMWVDVEATHFRQGNIAYEIQGQDLAITVTSSWRADATDPFDVTGCGLYIQFAPDSLVFTGTDFAGEAYSTFRKTILNPTLPSGPCVLSASSCCRISTLLVGADQSWTVATTFDPANLTSFRITSPALTQVGIAQTPTGVESFFVPVSPQPGSCFVNEVTSGVSGLASAGLSATVATGGCTVTWRNFNVRDGSKLPVPLRVSNVGGGFYADFDFIVEARQGTHSNVAPVCAGATYGGQSYGAGDTVTLPANSIVEINFVGTDADAGDSLTAATLLVPAGATLAPTAGVSPLSSTLGFVTGASDCAAPAEILQVVFVDDGGLQATCSVLYVVCTTPAPTPVPTSAPLPTNQPTAMPSSDPTISLSPTKKPNPSSPHTPSPTPRPGFTRKPTRRATKKPTRSPAST